ncbi:MAG: S8 family serine peptidase [Synergistaceae bacterium]|nr:S8 family serine peptidase [Synergistaceae bacterium]
MRKFFVAILFMSFLVVPSLAYDAVPGDVIVVLRNTSGVRISSANSAISVENLSAVQSFAQSANVNVVKTYDALSEVSNNIFMLVHSDKKNENDLLREIRQNPNVIAASLNRVIHLCADGRIPNDPEYYRLWGMEAINAPDVWNMSTGSEDVYVAVIDSGVDFEHEDLKDNFSHKYSMNFTGINTSGYNPNNYGDANDHGTHVSGTIAAVGNNGVGVAGVNWKAKIISLRVFDASGMSSNAVTVAAINHLTGLLISNPGLNVAALNMSLGGFSPLSPSEAVAENDPQYLALQALSSLNRTVICVAAGNENTEVGAPVMNTTYNSDGSIRTRKGWYCYPSGYPDIENMIVVAASGYTLQRASYSNYSSHYVHVAAPGGDIDGQNLSQPINGWIYSTIRAHDAENSTIYERELIKLENSKRTSFYGDLLGTSMATPHVAGAVALLKSIFPSATANQIKAAILGGANGDYLRDNNTSMYGLLDIRGAADFLAATLGENNPPKISAHELHNATAKQFYKFELKASGSEPITWSVEGNLPEGLSLDKNGYITGVTEKEGVYEFVITAENDYGHDSMIYTVSVDKGVAPVINMSSDINYSMTSTAYSFPVNISAGSWPIIYSIESSDMPSSFGLSFDKRGYVSFTPTQEGTYHLTLNAENYAGEDSKSFTVTVEAQKIPSIESKDLRPGIKGVRYAVSSAADYALRSIEETITAEGAVPMSWNITGLPDGLTLGKTTVYDKNGYSHKETVTIEGHAKEAGSFDVHVTVSNKFGTASRDFTIEIADLPPSFLLSSDTKNMQAGYYSTSSIFAVGTSPMTFTFEGTLPKGMAVKSNDNFAFLYGTPTETGTFSATVYASNDLGVASEDVTFIVREPAVITTNFLPDAVRGVAYNARLASFGDVALSWTLSSDLPAGLTLSESGDLSGIPTVAGKFLITINAKALDSSTNSHTRNYTLTVRDRPTIITASLPDGRMNTPYDMTALSADGTAPITWSVSGGNFPAGLTLAGNGYIFGTPTKSGTFAFTLRAANGVLYGEKSYTVNIASDGSDSGDIKPDSGDITPESKDIKPDSGDITPESKDVKPATITTGSARGISSLTIGELEAIADGGGLVAAVLPEISVNISDFYTYKSVDIFADVKLSDDVPAGYTLVWHPFTRSMTGAFIEDSANDSAEFYDSDGNIITDVPANRVVNVSAWLDSGKTYAPVISAVRPGQSGYGVGSSSGGCDSGVAGLAGLMLAAVIFSVSKKNDGKNS